MVIDSSALIAIVNGEPEAQLFAKVIAADPIRLMSTASFVETAIVVEARYRQDGARLLDELIEVMQVQLSPVTIEHAAAAREAFRTYGRGFHQARLNFGDCFSYALAKVTGEPLLFKGADFNLTDLGIVSQDTAAG